MKSAVFPILVKFCTRCRRHLTVNHYGINRSKPDGLQGYCNDCKKHYQNDWYERHKQSHGDNVRKLRRIKRVEARSYVYGLLQDKSCQDCGESNPIVLEFDHVRGKKKYNISDMMNGAYNHETIQSEIDKCDIVCANCHRIRTAYRQEWQIIDILELPVG